MSNENEPNVRDMEVVAGRVPEEVKKAAEKLAHKRSEPGDSVTMSQLVGDALVYYLDEVAASEFEDE
mgnify:CR=1 FL=1